MAETENTNRSFDGKNVRFDWNATAPNGDVFTRVGWYYQDFTHAVLVKMRVRVYESATKHARDIDADDSSPLPESDGKQRKKRTPKEEQPYHLSERWAALSFCESEKGATTVLNNFKQVSKSLLDSCIVAVTKAPHVSKKRKGAAEEGEGNDD